MWTVFLGTVGDLINAVCYAAWFTLAVFIVWFAWASWDVAHAYEEKAEAWPLWAWFHRPAARHMKERTGR